MMPRPVLPALLLTAIALPGSAYSEPTSYDECILETMKGVSSDIAAQAIIDSCRRMFPEAPEAETEPTVAPAAAAPAAATSAAPTGEAAAPAATSQPASTATPEAPAAATAATVTAVAAAATGSTSSSGGTVRMLTEEELDKLEYRGNFLGTTYFVKVFNGNENLTLTEVTIAVWDKDYIDGLETYRDDVEIEP